MKKKIHFGWFAGYGFGPPGWDAPYAAKGYDWREPELYQEMASICERGMSDFVLFADSLGISTAYEGSVANTVKYGLYGEYQDTTVLTAMIAQEQSTSASALPFQPLLYRRTLWHDKLLLWITSLRDVSPGMW